MIYSIDLGNSCIKWAKRTTKKSDVSCDLIPSYIGEIQEYDVESIGIGYQDDTSVLFKYLEGNRKDLIDTYWISGELAKDMRVPPLFSKDKHEFSLQGVVTVIASDINSHQQMRDLKIIYSVPDHRKVITYKDQDIKVTNFITKEIEGYHKVEVIIGQRIGILEFNISEVSVVPEGYGGYLYCLEHDLVNKQSKGKSLLVDVGTRTCIITPFSNKGIPLMNDRVMRGGVQELACMIREGKCLREADIFISPDEGSILEAIEREIYIYESTGVSFEDDYILYRDRWCSEVKDFIRTSTKQIGNINSLLFIGGGASLFKELSKKTKRIQISSNPRLANVLGMLNSRRSF